MLLVDIARLLLETAGALLGVALLLRSYMNWVGMPSRNPLAQFAIALTDWAVRPLRRLLPAVGRWDSASLLAAYLVAVVMLILTFMLIGAGPSSWPWPTLLFAALVQVLRWALYMVFFLTLVHVVLSWVNPYAPVAPAIAMLVRPFLAPLQRIVPPIGGVDLSPLLLIVLVNVLLLILSRL
ncbi:MAG: YggT family protein [Sutterellaceae bacterium]|nr:YggT family protein [Burkholderiaceae bacterium]MCX7902142.1 YggT family protein [Burkholderiaceae bacterium]MDW8429606.1 YggT family protein [Sutterellaceae bacterium]